jgi:hypothetical protein
MDLITLLDYVLKQGAEWNLSLLLLFLLFGIIAIAKRLKKIELVLLEMDKKETKCRSEIDLKLAQRPTFDQTREMIMDRVN